MSHTHKDPSCAVRSTVVPNFTRSARRPPHDTKSPQTRLQTLKARSPKQCTIRFCLQKEGSISTNLIATRRLRRVLRIWTQLHPLHWNMFLEVMRPGSKSMNQSPNYFRRKYRRRYHSNSVQPQRKLGPIEMKAIPMNWRHRRSLKSSPLAVSAPRETTLRQESRRHSSKQARPPRERSLEHGWRDLRAEWQAKACSRRWLKSSKKETRAR